MTHTLHDVLFVIDAKALDNLSSRVGEDLGSKFMDWATKVTGEVTRKNMEIYAGKVSNIRTIMEMSVEGLFGNSPIILGNDIIQMDKRTGLFDIDMGSLFISPSNVNKVMR